MPTSPKLSCPACSKTDIRQPFGLGAFVVSIVLLVLGGSLISSFQILMGFGVFGKTLCEITWCILVIAVIWIFLSGLLGKHRCKSCGHQWKPDKNAVPQASVGGEELTEAQPESASGQPAEITFACPSCDQNIACDMNYQGIQIKCPTCQGDITVPNAAPNVPPPPPPIMPVAKTANAPDKVAAAVQSTKNDDLLSALPPRLSVATCPLCHETCNENSIKSFHFDFASVVGVRVRKISGGPVYRSGNRCVGCIFTPLGKFPHDAACCDRCYQQYLDGESKAYNDKVENIAASRKKLFKVAGLAVLWLILGVVIVSLFNLGASFLAVLIFIILPVLTLLGCMMGGVTGSEELKQMKETQATDNDHRFVNYLIKRTDLAQRLRNLCDRTSVDGITFKNVEPGSCVSNKDTDLLFVLVTNEWKSSEMYSHGGRNWYWDWDPLFGFNGHGEYVTFGNELTDHGEKSILMGTVDVQVS